MAFVELKGVGKSYSMGETVIHANRELSFTVEEGEFVIIVGPSGAGKTTTLNLLGGMDSPTEGEIWVDGKEISTLDERGLTLYRRRDIGFVFQFYNLIPNLTARENVELASQIVEDPMDAEAVLRAVGLGERMDNFPARLSGGEQQRVAIARAVAKRPKLLLCDEPTGALDYQTGREVLKLLQDMSGKDGRTVIVITHNRALAPMADRIIEINDGRVREIRENQNPKPVEELEW